MPWLRTGAPAQLRFGLCCSAETPLDLGTGHLYGHPVMTAMLTVTHLADLADRYDALLCDVWGVIHNGIAAHPSAVDALRRFRAGGGSVLLITNAPRPSGSVVEQLDGLGVDRAAYDGVVSSGDVTRAALIARGIGSVYHLGPERDLCLFEGTGLALLGPDEAELIVCTGLFDDYTETPQSYRSQLERLAARGVPLVCANPDIVVERGSQLIYCAGALAELYATLGGSVEQFGKPHPPIYRAAFERLEHLRGRPVAPQAVLAVGDGIATDLKGAAAAACAALFITGGIHAGDFGAFETPDAALVGHSLSEHGCTAVGFAPRLTW